MEEKPSLTVDSFFVEWRGSPGLHREGDMMIVPEDVVLVRESIAALLRWGEDKSRHVGVKEKGSLREVLPYTIKEHEFSGDRDSILDVLVREGYKFVVVPEHKGEPISIGNKRPENKSADENANEDTRAQQIADDIIRVLDASVNWKEMRSKIKKHKMDGSMLFDCPLSDLGVHFKDGGPDSRSKFWRGLVCRKVVELLENRTRLADGSYYMGITIEKGRLKFGPYRVSC